MTDDTAQHTLVYNDRTHAYYLDGKRCKGVSTVAKIPTDTYNIEAWGKRMVAVGLTLDPTLIENVAAHIDNKQRLDEVVDNALRAGKAHAAADRGTQMHRVLELVLLDQEDKLLTAQQKADAEVLKRTLDRYKLTPHQNMAEQFVLWPHYLVAGRFDAILETPNGDLVLTDLKSGPNAVAFPHATCIQLALYARAPLMSADIHTQGDKATITSWRDLPERLNRNHAYVLLVTPDDTVGTLHRLDIRHGWAAAQIALNTVEWRKQLNNGKGIAEEVLEPEPPRAAPATWESLMATADSVARVREIWDRCKELGELTPEIKQAGIDRFDELTA